MASLKEQYQRIKIMATEYMPSLFQSSTVQPSSTNVTKTEERPITESWLPSNASRMTEAFAMPSFYKPADISALINSTNYWYKWRFYSEMEINWSRVLKNITYLKQSVANQSIILKTANKSKEATKAYDLVYKAIGNIRGNASQNINNFQQIIEDIIDAYGKGISIQELYWEEVGKDILPYGSTFYNGQQYVVNINVSESIPLIQLRVQDGLASVDPNRFITAIYRNRSTNNMTTFGVYQSIAKYYYFQHLGINQLVKLCQYYGIPFRKVGVNKQTISKQERADIATQMNNIIANGWIMLPSDSDFEMVTSAMNATNNPQQALIDYCNKECDLLMLGQNLTSDITSGGSYAAASAHAKKETNVISNLTDFALDTLNHQFIPAVLNANGIEDLENKPYLIIEEQKNWELLASKLQNMRRLAKLGFTVDFDNLKADLDEYGIIIKESPPIDPALLSGNQPIVRDQQTDNIDADMEGDADIN